MQYNFDQIIKRSHTHCVKWEFMQIQDVNANKDTLPFWIADMDFACPPPLLEAVKERADQLILGYSMADAGYHEAVCSWMMRRFQWTVNPSEIFISSGVVPALMDLILSLTNPGDGIIIQRPVYYPFSAIISHAKRTLINNPLRNTDGSYAIDFKDLEHKAKNPATTMMLFCSPHNPVGRVWTEEELLQVADICLKNDVILVSDEIHADLLRQGNTHSPIAGLLPDEDTIITCTAPSKTFNVAGLQLANIIIRNKLFQKKWIAQTGPEFPPPLALAAVKAAYTVTETENWLDQLLVYLDDNFVFLADYLARHLPKAQFTPPEGTYLAWIDFSGYGHDDLELADILLKKANVLLEGGAIFGPEGAGFQRMNIACPRAMLEQGLRQITTALTA